MGVNRIGKDRTSHHKQRHTAKRIFDRLRDEYGFTGGYTIVKDYVRERRLRSREMFVPHVHSPGHAQADFGEAMAVIGGVARKVHFLAFDLPHSDACFVKAYPAETTEAFCDGHNAAVAFFGGVPRSILYDNTKLAVARILGDGKRQRTRVFTELQSHYLFEDRFGRPGKGNDKGKVEGLVGFIRRNFLVPVPRAESFEALNDALAGQCRRRQMARLRGHGETIGERLARDRQALLPLPPAPYDACDKRPGRVSSLSLVRYRDNDYSVPVAYGYREVVIRGYVDQVVIGCGAEVIARHRRSYEREDLIFDPLHYLPLIEQKIGALGPGRAAGGLGPAGGLRHAAPSDGGAHGQGRQAGVRPGPASPGELPPRRGRGGDRRCAEARRDRLRRRQAPSAVPDRTTAATARPRCLSLSSKSPGRDDVGQELHEPAARSRHMSDAPQVLLDHHLKTLKLPTFLREYGKLARQCASEGVDHVRYLHRLAELELIDRERRMVERRIKAARFPRGQEPRCLRLKGHPLAQQDAGARARPLRVR